MIQCLEWTRIGASPSCDLKTTLCDFALSNFLAVSVEVLGSDLAKDVFGRFWQSVPTGRDAFGQGPEGDATVRLAMFTFDGAIASPVLKEHVALKGQGV